MLFSAHVVCLMGDGVLHERGAEVGDGRDDYVVYRADVSA